MIIRSSRELKESFHALGPGDIFVGMLAYKHLKQSVLIDLLERGITCLPSPLAQSLNGSKAAQALIFMDYMAPHTSAITRRIDLIDTINHYNNLGITTVVSKEDHLHCGHGIRRWEDIETLYSFMALEKSSYPFVVQPFLDNLTDVRVIIAGEYIEAYVRYNPDNFRMNISSGGQSYPYDLNKEQVDFCFKVMERGKFPYAHLDLQITESGQYYLSEIALNGGLKGARITREELDQHKQALLEKLAVSNI